MFVEVATKYPTVYPKAFADTLPNLLRKIDMQAFMVGVDKGWKEKDVR